MLVCMYVYMVCVCVCVSIHRFVIFKRESHFEIQYVYLSTVRLNANHGLIKHAAIALHI